MFNLKMKREIRYVNGGSYFDIVRYLGNSCIGACNYHTFNSKVGIATHSYVVIDMSNQQGI